MKFKLIYFVLILFFLSCKNENAFIEGRVLEEDYNIPVVGARIGITATTGGGHLNSIANGITDADGHFRIDYFRKGPMTNYEFEISSDQVFGGLRSNLSSKKVSKDFFLPSLSHAKFRIKNNQTNDIFLSLQLENSFSFDQGIGVIRIKANADSLITNAIKIKGFGKTAFTCSVSTSSIQSLPNIIKDTVSVFTKTDTVIHLIEIN